MKSERWSDMESLYRAALQREPEHRRAFLNDACSGNADLLHEVESLLEYDEQAKDFLEVPAIDLEARSIAKLPDPPLIGRQLSHYRIMEKIGEGGMGEVYRGKDTRLNRTVAVKVLSPDFAARSEFRQRFEREAKAISALNHPHICVLYDLGRQEGVDFLVMEYLAGETLAQRLERGPLPLKEALEYSLQIADALDKAHSAGFVHRDLKPRNIVITEAGAKLLDFGLAKRLDMRTADSGIATDAGPITRAGTILGTIQYMSPEQLEGQEADE